MTHRDGFPHASRLGLSARSAWRGDAGPREPRATLPAPGPESPGTQDSGKPPFRSRGRTGSGLPGGRRQALPMPRIACGLPPARPLARRIAHAISMGHYQRSLV